MRHIDWDFRISTELLELDLKKGLKPTLSVYVQAGKLSIICPPHLDFTSKRIQAFMHAYLANSILRTKAQLYLPAQLHALATLHGFTYHTITIKRVHTIWGSCSSLHNINLSLYLILLPSHLVDYVLLHELCHTRHLNHSADFWNLLNTLTSGKALALRNELHTYLATRSPYDKQNGGLIRRRKGMEDEVIL
ncbi:MAG: M48 family metallopeptidase [Bacteroidaceae bacterium]